MKHFRHLRNKTISDLSVALDDESIASVQLSFTDGTAYAIFDDHRSVIKHETISKASEVHY